ncbi:hypothetical protein TRVL_09098 [Trypanosoma vivax]|nr:hypothetical protein TRVL_09098 [Trypanosoma vivax]
MSENSYKITGASKCFKSSIISVLWCLNIPLDFSNKPNLCIAAPRLRLAMSMAFAVHFKAGSLVAYRRKKFRHVTGRGPPPLAATRRGLGVEKIYLAAKVRWRIPAIFRQRKFETGR